MFTFNEMVWIQHSQQIMYNVHVMGNGNRDGGARDAGDERLGEVSSECGH